MEFLKDLFQNKALIAAVLAWLFAQLIKTVICAVVSKKLQMERMWGAGGMPSAHSSMVCALAIATARFYGADSPIFALSLVLALVTIYDAMGVRREAGRHAKVLNHYLNGLELDKAETEEEAVEFETIDLKELIGHTPMQVIMGAIFGIVYAFYMHLMVFASNVN